jgi:hypothetical protein
MKPAQSPGPVPAALQPNSALLPPGILSAAPNEGPPLPDAPPAALTPAPPPRDG